MIQASFAFSGAWKPGEVIIPMPGEQSLELLPGQHRVLCQVDLAAVFNDAFHQLVNEAIHPLDVTFLGMQFEVQTVTVFTKRDDVVVHPVHAHDNFRRPARRSLHQGNHSADRGTAPRGGDLDFFTRERMVKPFADAAFAMQPGEVSDIVETQYGYHIIKVTERKEASVRPFEEVKAAIVQHLTTQKRTEIAKEYVDELREKATIVYVSGEQPGAAEPAPSTLEAPPAPADPNAG